MPGAGLSSSTDSFEPEWEGHVTLAEYYPAGTKILRQRGNSTSPVFESGGGMPDFVAMIGYIKARQADVGLITKLPARLAAMSCQLSCE